MSGTGCGAVASAADAPGEAPALLGDAAAAVVPEVGNALAGFGTCKSPYNWLQVMYSEHQGPQGQRDNCSEAT